MLFNYQLRDLDDIEPWLNEAEEPFLNWFALSDGWYWVEADDKQILTYTDEALKTLEAEFGPAPHNYVDYYVARLWEDLLDILPQVLNPLPRPLIERLEAPEEWLAWLAQAETWLFDQDEEDEEPFTLYFQAAGWWSARLLDISYMDNEPLLYFWRQQHDIYLYWNSQDAQRDGPAFWNYDPFITSMPIADFRQEMKWFNRRLLQDMSERIAGLLGSEAPDYVQIDAEQLKQEQRDRTHWLAEQMDALPSDDWDATLKAIAALELRL